MSVNTVLGDERAVAIRDSMARLEEFRSVRLVMSLTSAAAGALTMATA